MLREIVGAILVLGLALAWILFIASGTEVPDAFIGVAAGGIGEWILEGGYRGYKEWQRRV